MAKTKAKKRASESIDNLVSICTNESLSANALLEESLSKSNFWKIIEKERRAKRSKKTDFTVIIKPDFEIFEPGAPTGTDPELVEHLIDLLFENGYTNVSIADSVGEADLWLENRDVLILADLIGYRYETKNGNVYEVHNLSENVNEKFFQKSSILHDSGLSEEWIDADFRINFCKNKSDEENFYSLAAKNLLQILPLRSKFYHYKNRLKSPEVVRELLNNTQVHFTIIDGYISNHGSQGSRHQNPLETKSIIAGNNLLLVDWVGALKMGIDPYSSELNGPLLQSIGLPDNYKIDGDLSPYKNWRTSNIFLQESIKKRNEIASVSKLSTPWVQKVDTDIFPFKNLLDEQINSFLTPLIHNIDQKPFNQWILITFNYFLVNLNKTQEAWQILYDKEHLYRKEISLNINPNEYRPADYDEVEHYIQPFIQILKHTPPDRNGIKWRYINESVLFEYTKIIPVQYEQFIQNVDISAAVEMMYDNIGVCRVAVKSNRQRKAVHQAERDIYLPQPNWMVLFGGEYIDVDKIEVIRYHQNEQQIFWRCVNSQNKSAEYDDGMVSFKKHQGGTLVTIIARQKFELPLFWQVFNMDYFPEVKNSLVSDSYIRFLSRTMTNYEAASEGRSTLIGKHFDQNYGESDQASAPLETEQLKQIFSMISGLATKWSSENGKGDDSEIFIDDNGYRHFKATDQPNNVVRGFFSDLMNAFQKDMRLMYQPIQKNKE